MASMSQGIVAAVSLSAVRSHNEAVYRYQANLEIKKAHRNVAMSIYYHTTISLRLRGESWENSSQGRCSPCVDADYRVCTDDEGNQTCIGPNCKASSCTHAMDFPGISVDVGLHALPREIHSIRRCGIVIVALILCIRKVSQMPGLYCRPSAIQTRRFD